MADPFKIRPARRSDREAITALLRELGHESCADSNTWFWVMNHPEIDVLVAADPQDRPIGLVSLSHRPQLRLNGRLSSIDELVVTEGWRGKGVGTKLVAAAIARAKAMSAKMVEVSENRDRDTLRRGFFEKCGFVECQRAVFRLRELKS